MAATRKRWKDYEEVARHVLRELREELGISEVEGDQTLPGKSGTDWSIEGRAIPVPIILGGFLVIECKRYLNKRLSQETIGGLAFRITDLGASGGIIVSPLDLQQGAKLVAAHTNILPVQLAPWSTSENYLAKLLGKAFHKVSLSDAAMISDRPEATVTRAGKVVKE